MCQKTDGMLWIKETAQWESMLRNDGIEILFLNTSPVRFEENINSFLTLLDPGFLGLK